MVFIDNEPVVFGGWEECLEYLPELLFILHLREVHIEEHNYFTLARSDVSSVRAFFSLSLLFIHLLFFFFASSSSVRFLTG